MHSNYVNASTLAEIIAIKTTNYDAIQAALQIPQLRWGLCLNPNLDEKTWFNLAKEKASADDLYFLGLNSKTAKQADFIFNDKRYVPKVGLLKGNNPEVKAEFLEKLYAHFKHSAIIQEALINRSDLPLDILGELAKNPKLLYHLMNNIFSNENVTLNWILNYYENTAGQLERKIFLQSLPRFLDKYPERIDYFLTKATSYDITTTTTDKLNMLSVIAETRFLTIDKAEEIFTIVKNHKSRSSLKAKILSSLLGNPNISQDLVEKIVAFFNSSPILTIADTYQVINFKALVDSRGNLPKISIKPGWDYRFSPEEIQLLDGLKLSTQNHAARISILRKYKDPVFYPSKTNAPSFSLTEKEILEAPANLDNSRSHWSWMSAAVNSVNYIDTNLEDEPRSTWVNLFNLASNWENSIGELLTASKNL